jgi:hypothetical protein
MLKIIKEGKTELPANAISALTTALIGVFISIAGLVSYSYIQVVINTSNLFQLPFLFGGTPLL